MNEVAARQRGLVTQDDLRAGGVSTEQRKALLSERTLVRIGQRTYRHAAVSLDDPARVLASRLDTGGAVACRSAAWVHGLPNFAAGSPPEVLIATRKADYRATLARVHTTTRLPADDLIEVDGLLVTSVARTLFSLAALVPEISPQAVRAAVDDAIRMRKASDRWLWHRLEELRCRGRNGVSVLETILTARAGGAITESWLEREFLRVLGRVGLAPPQCQARIKARGAFVARVDFLYAAERVVIEVTGAVAHSTPSQRAADARRRNELARLGYFVLEFTYEQVVGEPDRVGSDVIGALSERRAA